MSEIIEVTIHSDWKSAKEVNPIKMPDAFFEGKKKDWNQAEEKLRTFEIENNMIRSTQTLCIVNHCRRVVPREIWKAEILHNGKIKIL